MQKLRRFVCIFLLLLTNPTFADWTKVQTLTLVGPLDVSFYVDFDLLRRDSDNKVTFWILQDFSLGLSSLSSKILLEVDCAKGKYRSVKIERYPDHMGRGEVSQVIETNGEWRTGNEPAVDEHTLWVDIACGKLTRKHFETGIF